MSFSLPRRLSADTPNAIIGSVSLSHFLSHFYFLSFPPLFPLLFAEFDVTYAELGLLVSSLYAMMFVFQIPFGWIVDRGYAKYVLVGGILLTTGGLIGASTATSYPILLGFALLSGIGQATYHPADYTLIDVVSSESRVGRNFSLHTFAGYAGSGAAPIIVGGIGARSGWRTALLLIGMIGVVYAVALQLGVETVYADQVESASPNGEEAEEGDQSVLRELLRPFYRLPILGMFLFFVVLIVGESGIQSFTIVFLVESLGLDESTGNTALTAFFTLTAVGVLVGGFLADRYNAANIVIGSLVLTAVVTFLLAFGLLPVTVVVSLVLFAVIGFSYGVVMPARDRLVSTFSPEQSVGKSFGLVFTGAAVGGTAGPVLIGSAIDMTGPSASMLIVGTFFLVGSGIVLLVKLSRLTTGLTISTLRDII